MRNIMLEKEKKRNSESYVKHSTEVLQGPYEVWFRSWRQIIDKENSGVFSYQY